MKKNPLAAALLALPAMALAQAPAQPREPSPFSVTGNMQLVSSYRFRGIDQTFGKPALQGGIDLAHASGLYLGNWNSNVNEGAGYPNASLEMDFYGGWKPKFGGDFFIDAGYIYYYYPGSEAGNLQQFTPTNNRTGEFHVGPVNNKEVYFGAGWKTISVKYFYSAGDYFSYPGTKGSDYVDASASYTFDNGWGVNAHWGHLRFKTMIDADYSDWKLGITKDVGGWILGASYVGTSAKGDCSAVPAQFYCYLNASGTLTKDAGRKTAVLSIGKTF